MEKKEQATVTEMIQTPLYEADSEYTYEAYEKYSKTLGRKINHFNTYRIVMTTGFLALAVIWYFLGNMQLALILFFAGLCLPFALTLKQNQAIKKGWNSNSAIQGLKSHYEFYSDHMEQKNSTGNLKLEYSKIYRVVETEDAYYILVGRNQGMMIQKKDCSQELCEFLTKL